MAKKYPPLWGRILRADGTVICEWHPDTDTFFVNASQRDAVLLELLLRVREAAGDMVSSGDGSLLNLTHPSFNDVSSSSDTHQG